jgi:hypothetical protein
MNVGPDEDSSGTTFIRYNIHQVPHSSGTTFIRYNLHKVKHLSGNKLNVVPDEGYYLMNVVSDECCT